MKRKVQQGFTLIELMIVIAIVAILVALAVPAYQDYAIRAKAGECINAAAVPKLQISEYYETVGNFPTDINEAGMTGTGDSQYCDNYTTYNGVANTSANFNIEINSNDIGCNDCTEAMLTPLMTGVPNASGGVDWRCSRGGVEPEDLKFLPSTCRGSNT
jgi:type IV pilus assembly protein PilA